MSDVTSRDHVAHLVDPREVDVLDVLGPTVEFLTPPGADDHAPCLMRGTIAPGIVVPLHSHADPETFLMVSGEIEGLAQSGDAFEWVGIQAGDVFHVPGLAKHAFRNQAKVPAAMFVITTSKIARFFEEVGAPAVPGARPAPVSATTIRHFLETADRYGYWNATPEENAAVGISLALA